MPDLNRAKYCLDIKGSRNCAAINIKTAGLIRGQFGYNKNPKTEHPNTGNSWTSPVFRSPLNAEWPVLICIRLFLDLASWRIIWHFQWIFFKVSSFVRRICSKIRSELFLAQVMIMSSPRVEHFHFSVVQIGDWKKN